MKTINLKFFFQIYAKKNFKFKSQTESKILNKSFKMELQKGKQIFLSSLLNLRLFYEEHYKMNIPNF